jgi:hypothetical protein
VGADSTSGFPTFLTLRVLFFLLAFRAKHTVLSSTVFTMARVCFSVTPPHRAALNFLLLSLLVWLVVAETADEEFPEEEVSCCIAFVPIRCFFLRKVILMLLESISC